MAATPTGWTGKFGGWLEGNAVVTPEGNIVDLLRCDVRTPPERAALVRISDDGTQAAFDPADGFVAFPGGAKKFTVRFDPQSKLYWSLVNLVAEPDRSNVPGAVRNTLALVCSPDVRHWNVCRELLHHPTPAQFGFQYCDWQFDGQDIIAVVRTAFTDQQGGAHNYHDANYLTFHQVNNFRASAQQP